ncbi:MAG: hypothetical protein Q9208_001492 [Pyrenodesmia sp. 3 TL-2023]
MTGPAPKAPPSDRPHTSPPRPNVNTNEEPYEELEITFNKTLEGHYRHGKTGYQRVGVLFLTWEEDDLQCKETEVDALRELFAKDFKYETAYFQIPKVRWQTALQKRIADLFYEKFAADESGDPTLFMNDILGCCRLPACDQLLILDCCFAANAFRPEHIGKRKCEMIVSSGCDRKVPGPHQPGSFTKRLNEVLVQLLQQNKNGFATSQLYREIYHAIPHQIKPWLFDQARRDYGRIWLRPQVSTSSSDAEPEEGGAYLNLTLKLNKEPDSVVMNQLALHLQYLPHIDQVRFEKLYAPKRQIENFMQFVQRAVKLRPLIRKMHAKRRLKKLTALSQSEMILQRPLSYMKLLLDQKQSSAFDWSSALDGHNPTPSSPALHRRGKSFTWPPVEADAKKKGKTGSNRLFSVDYQLALPSTSSIPRFFQPRRTKTMADVETSSHPVSNWDFLKYRHTKGALSREASVSNPGRSWGTFFSSEESWHTLMWLTLCYALWCICYHIKE